MLFCAFFPHGSVFTQESTLSHGKSYSISVIAKSVIAEAVIFYMHPFMDQVGRACNVQNQESQ